MSLCVAVCRRVVAVLSPCCRRVVAVLSPCVAVCRCVSLCFAVCGAGVMAELTGAHMELHGLAYRFSTPPGSPIHVPAWVLTQEAKGERGKEWPDAANRTLRELCQL